VIGQQLGHLQRRAPFVALDLFDADKRATDQLSQRCLG
jgi:hypothetical protein